MSAGILAAMSSVGLLEKSGEFILKHRKVRTVTFYANILSIISGAAPLIYLSVRGTPDQLSYYLNHVLPFFVIIPLITLFSISLYFVANTKGYVQIELDKIHVEREKITHKIESEETPDIFDTIQLSLNQITEYYTINKGQATKSFNFSIFAIVIGLLTLLAGVWLRYVKYTDIEVTYITAVAGAVLEFIGGAYFFIYKKSVEQVNFFFGQLIRIQDTMVAINLAKNTVDENKRDALVEKIVVSLLERSLQ